MNTKILKCFQTVYEEKNLGRAARRLYITPQGLSKNIRQLEEELGSSLFLRTAQGMEPTEGDIFSMKSPSGSYGSWRRLSTGFASWSSGRSG